MNLLCSRFGIDNFNILEGLSASNGFQMINFFKKSLHGESSIGKQSFCGKPVTVLKGLLMYFLGCVAEDVIVN